jgi:hypothetical protein
MSTVAFTKPAFNSIYIPVIPASMMYCGKPFGTEADIAYLFEHVMQIGIVRRTDIITRQKGHIHVRSAFVHFSEWLPNVSEWFSGLVTPDSELRIHGHAWNGFWGGVPDELQVEEHLREYYRHAARICTSRYLTIKINKNPIIDVEPMQLEQLNVHQLVDNIRRLEEQLTARDARIAELEEREVRRENDRDDVLAGMAIEITELRKLNKKMETEMEWQNQLLDHRLEVIEKLEKEIAYTNDGGYPDEPLTLADLQMEEEYSPETAEEEAYCNDVYVPVYNDRRMKKFYNYDSEEEDEEVMCPPLSMEDLEVQEITETAEQSSYGKEDGEYEEDEEPIYDGRTLTMMNENIHLDEMTKKYYTELAENQKNQPNAPEATEEDASAGDDEFTFDFQQPLVSLGTSIQGLPSSIGWPAVSKQSPVMGLHFVTELPFNMAVSHINDCLSSFERDVVMFEEVLPFTSTDSMHRTWKVLSIVDQTYMELKIYQNYGHPEYIIEGDITQSSEYLFDIFDTIHDAMNDKSRIGHVDRIGTKAIYGM